MASHHHFSKARLAQAGAMLVLLGTPAAHAQNTADARGVEEVVVTAQRRTERLQDVPIAIAVRTGEQLARSGVTSVRDLEVVTPGLRYGLSVLAIPSIRGINTQQSDPGNDPNVALYVDNVYMPDPQANNLDLPDVERIEVLKGPQGTLFGRNATGGAIRVFTKAPSFTPTGMVDVSYGNYDDFTAKAYLSGPIVDDKLAASISGYFEQSDEYNLNLLTNKRERGLDNRGARLRLLATPTERFTANLIFGYTEHYNGNAGAWTTPNGNNLARILSPTAIIPTKQHEYVVNQQHPHVSSVSKSVALKMDLDTDAGVLSSITSYNAARNNNDSDGDFSSLDLLAYPIQAQTKSVSQELTFSSKKFGDFQITGGGNYYHGTGWYNPLGVSGTFVIPTLYGYMRQGTDAYAFFSEIAYEPVERLNIIIGGRYSHEERDAAGLYGIVPVKPATLPPIGTGKLSFNRFTPRATVRYTFESDDNIYFSYSQGFKSGGFNISSLQANPFAPEKVHAFEVGLKTAADRSISGNFSAFYYKYTNQQQQTFVGGFNVTSNAASSKIYGLDADIVFRPWREFTVTTGISYLHARFDRYPGAVFNVPTGGPTCLCGNSTTTGDLSGGRQPGAPDFTASITANYVHEISAGEIQLNTSFYYTSKYSLENSGRIVQDPYATLTARASFQPAGSNFSVYVWGKNLTDHGHIVAQFISGSGDGVAYSPPRTYGVGAKYEF